jgi:hypothetical protein
MRGPRQLRVNAAVPFVTTSLLFCAALLGPPAQPTLAAALLRPGAPARSSDVGAPPVRSHAVLQRTECDNGRPSFAASADLSGVKGATFAGAEALAGLAEERRPVPTEYARGHRGRAPPSSHIG